MNRDLLQVTNILFHDLREPIRKIETFSNLILSDATLNSESQLALTKIDLACGRMSQLLRALQQFVSVESAHEPLALVELNSLVTSAFNAVRETHPDCHAGFESENLPSVEGYPRQLDLLFAQLFDNAFKFRRLSGDLRIRVTSTVIQQNHFESLDGRYRYVDFVHIFFSDNGIGIPEVYRESVFELLKKLDIGNPQPGCGLAICKKVTENHYGSITVVPNADGGTTFKISLPLKQS
jgi:sigma-B regulation protein RsbU (phosphoserine phosphatase)